MNFANVKSITIPEGKVARILSGNTVLWKAPPSYTNQVPISTDTDGSIFNGVGYIENRRLSSSGGLSSSAQNGSVTTGFIPFPTGDKTIIRMKGVDWVNAQSKQSGHYYLMFYDADKKVVDASNNRYESPATGQSHILTITRDTNGVETFDFNESYGTTNSLFQLIRNKAKFIRITVYGKGADMIVTINEEIPA